MLLYWLLKKYTHKMLLNQLFKKNLYIKCYFTDLLILLKKTIHKILLNWLFFFFLNLHIKCHFTDSLHKKDFLTLQALICFDLSAFSSSVTSWSFCLLAASSFFASSVSWTWQMASSFSSWYEEVQKFYFLVLFLKNNNKKV